VAVGAGVQAAQGQVVNIDRIDKNQFVKLADLRPHSRNYNAHSDAQIAKLAKSLSRFGQVRSIVVRDNTILAGHGVVEAAKSLGWTELRADVVDELSEDEALAYVVADNELARQSDPDQAQLAAILEELQAREPLLVEAVGYSTAELEQLLRLVNPREPMDAQQVIAIYSQEQIIDAAFTWFRANGFPYRNLAPHVSMQEINKLLTTEPENLIGTDTAYHVADTYHPHRYHACAEGMRSQYDSFVDDVLLKKALTLELEYGSIGLSTINNLKFVNGTQPLSNFRPGFAAHLYRRFCSPHATVLDTSTGYGGRLVGFIGSGVDGFYIGIDPNADTHNANLRMAQELGFADKIELYNLPAEDVPHEAIAGRCDFAFTSPPYFRKEHYSDDDTQSWKRYPTGHAWREGFLVPMMALQYAALKRGCMAIVNIADVKIKSKTYPLVEWTVEAGKEVGFEFIEREEFPLTRRFGADVGDEVAIEPVLIFRKHSVPLEGA